MNLLSILIVFAAIINGYRAYLLATIIQTMKGKQKLSISEFLEMIFSLEGFWIGIFIIPIKNVNDDNLEKNIYKKMNLCTYIIYLIIGAIIFVSLL